MDKQGYVWISKPQKYFLYILPKLGRKLFSCSPANIQKPLQKVPSFTHVLENRILDNRTHKMGWKYLPKLKAIFVQQRCWPILFVIHNFTCLKSKKRERRFHSSCIEVFKYFPRNELKRYANHYLASQHISMFFVSIYLFNYCDKMLCQKY